MAGVSYDPLRYLLPKDRIRRMSAIDPQSGCWNWQGPVEHPETKPYGRLWIGKGRTSRKVQAHRFSYEAFKGPIPDGLFVCHRCDNHRCVNPDHLFVGTAKDNTADAMNKRRMVFPPHVPGESHPQAKLTANQVLAIRADRRISRLVAADYGVSSRQIRAIRSGECWRMLGAA